MQVADGRPPDGATLALAWYSEWYWVPFLHLTLVGLPVLLPTGELRSLRARRVWNVMLVSIVATTALAMFQGVLLADEDTIPIANPVGWLPYVDVDHTPLVFAIIAAVILLGGVAVFGVVRRLRRAAGVERRSCPPPRSTCSPTCWWPRPRWRLLPCSSRCARVQAAVHRRFNRARYDAVLVVEQFASRLRHDVDLGALVHDLNDTVATTVQPAHVSLWLPGRQTIR